VQRSENPELASGVEDKSVKNKDKSKESLSILLDVFAKIFYLNRQRNNKRQTKSTRNP